MEDIQESYILEMLERDVEPEVRQRAESAPERPLIGYRRYPVRVALRTGWSIEVPGEFAERWQQDDPEMWNGWAGGRSVWFKFYPARGLSPEQMLELMKLPEGEPVPYQGQGHVGGAVFRRTQEKGKPLWNLSARTACRVGSALCNIFVADPADREWAVATWHSLRHTQVRG